MFDLNQAIAQWRRQMLAAGITSLALKELESHVLDDVDYRMGQGLTAQQAFEAAVRGMGRTDMLKAEFDKARDFFGWLGGSRSAKINHILGVLWLAGCLWSFGTVCRRFALPAPATSAALNLLFLNTLVALIYVAGMFGSVLLIHGATWGLRIVRMLALLMVIACAAQVLDFRMDPTWHVWCGAVALFSLVTIGLLHPPLHRSPKGDVTAE